MKRGVVNTVTFAVMILSWVIVMSHTSYAGDDFFSTFSNNLSTFLFKDIGKILFLVFIVAGIVSMSKSLAVAIVLWAIAVLLAVGGSLAPAIWNLFTGSSSSSSSSNSQMIMYAFNCIKIMAV